jgi:predicted GNAT family N-acyltransferase
MARAQIKLAGGESLDREKNVRHRLDALNAARIAKHLAVFKPSDANVADLMDKARQSVPGLCETSEVLRVLHYNPDCILTVTRRAKFNPAAPEGEGMIAFLPLNLLGLQHLALGTINASAPDFRLLAKPHARPAGIYLWLVYAPGPLAASMALLMERLSAHQYAGVNIYARAATEDGRRFSQVLGFRQGTIVGELEAPNVWVFERQPHRPPYDCYVPGAAKGVIGVTLARSWEDMLRVNAIRNAVYIGEQECPYEEEYDGNDLSGTHLLAYMGDEPIGTLRLRFFADFAKIERLAIRKEFRRSQAAFQLVRAGFKFCQKKGYGRVVAHSQVRLVDFWHRFGFKVLEGVKPFVFSDFDYIEMVAELERDPDAISIGTDPYVMIRPEGRWEEPGILEKSAVRDASRPSVAKAR